MPPKRRRGRKGRGNKSATKKAAERQQVQNEMTSDKPYSATGLLLTQVLNNDVRVGQFSVQLEGKALVEDTELELIYGHRYGLIGRNGSGKSTMLKAIADRMVPIPENRVIYFLDNECEPIEKTPVDILMEDMNALKAKLEKEMEQLIDEELTESDRFRVVCDELDNMEGSVPERKARKILTGLGFSPDMQEQFAKDFSGGWRMRISLAKVLFIRPDIMLLDEPTNHLDLEACVWLEEYLKTYDRVLVIVSHSQDFLNGVCTKIMHLKDRVLKYYGGNYDTFVKTRAELEENQARKYEWEQDKMREIKNFVAKFGHGTKKLARQAQSREKWLKRMEDAGLTEAVTSERMLNFYFMHTDKIPPPVMMFEGVDFAYPSAPDKVLYKDLNFGIDCDTRISLVGPNGVGKSTLLKLMVDELKPSNGGGIRRHTKLKIGWYHQHLNELLDEGVSPLEYICAKYPDEEKSAMRQLIGRFGITGDYQTKEIGRLSDGLKNRVVLAELCWSRPHILLLDEPTNHLDIETIDSLAIAINNFDGGIVLVSHDFRLIEQVDGDIWVCGNQTVTKWNSSIRYHSAPKSHFIFC